MAKYSIGLDFGTLSVRGVLADIAPTMLQIMGEKQPNEMSGKSLINFACHNC